MSIQETSNFSIVAMITRGNLLGTPPTFFESQNPNIGRSKKFVDVPVSFLWTDRISEILILIIPLEGIFAQGVPLVMVAM